MSAKSWLGHATHVLLYRARFIPFVSPAIRRLSNLFLSPAPHMVRVLSGPFKGQRLCVNRQHEKYFWFGTHEPDVQWAVKRAVRPGMIVYDVGGHVGFFSIALARLVGPRGRVFAFEPYPPNVARLRAAVAANRLSNLEVIPLAVSADCGASRFGVARASTMGKLLEGQADTGADALTVETVSIDAFVYVQGHPSPDLIKIDVEGAESGVLEGARMHLQQGRPILIIEIHGERQAAAVAEILDRCAYSVRALTGEPLPASPDRLRPGHYLAYPPEGAGAAV